MVVYKYIVHYNDMLNIIQERYLNVILPALWLM